MDSSPHRLISRDRPTKTGSLCLCKPFFNVAACAYKGYSGWGMGWYYLCKRKFLKENKCVTFCEIIVLYQRREVGYFLFCADRIYRFTVFTGLEPISFRFEIKE